MSASAILLNRIQNGEYDKTFARLYGQEKVAAQRARYAAAVEGFVRTFGDGEEPLQLFPPPAARRSAATTPTITTAG